MAAQVIIRRKFIVEIAHLAIGVSAKHSNGMKLRSIPLPIVTNRKQ